MSDAKNKAVPNQDSNPEPGGKSIKRDPNIFPWRLATLVLLLTASVLLYFLNSIGKSHQEEIDVQMESIRQLRDQLKDSEIANERLSEQLQVIANPNVDRIQLSSTTSDDHHYAMLYRNRSRHVIYIDPTQLPEPRSGKQYQLWGISGNKTVDMGTVLTGDIGFQQMKHTDSDSFFLTLEPAGGSDEPNLEHIIATTDQLSVE